MDPVSQRRQRFSVLLQEVNTLAAKPSQAGLHSLDDLSRDDRQTMANMTTEARSIVKAELGFLNDFDVALMSMGIPSSRTSPKALADLMERARLQFQNKAIARTSSAVPPTASPEPSYVDEVRLRELRDQQARPAAWDLTRLIRLCEEINAAQRAKAWISLALLQRAVKDWCAPVFGCRNFAEVAANAPKSHKPQFQRLEDSLKNVADGLIHKQSAKSDSLPTETQVNYRQEFDVLLQEIIAASK